MVGVRISEISEILHDYYFNNINKTILLLGSAGIGKSQVVKYHAKLVAEKLGKIFVEYNSEIANKIIAENQYDKYFIFKDVRIIENDPSEFIGLPEKTVSSPHR